MSRTRVAAAVTAATCAFALVMTTLGVALVGGVAVLERWADAKEGREPDTAPLSYGWWPWTAAALLAVMVAAVLVCFGDDRRRRGERG